MEIKKSMKVKNNKGTYNATYRVFNIFDRWIAKMIIENEVYDVVASKKFIERDNAIMDMYDKLTVKGFHIAK